MVIVNIVILIASSFLMAFSGQLLVDNLVRIAKIFKWREFVVGFIIMSIASSAPNLFVGVSAALQNLPELSLGEIMGGSVVDLTLAVAIGVLLSSGIAAESRMVQSSALFTLGLCTLPILLILDGNLSRLDGVLLIISFIFYSIWLFSKEERFRKTYEESETNKKSVIKTVLIIAGGIILLVVGSQGVIQAASFFSDRFNLQIGLVGILLVGLGNCLPEIYFTIVSGKKNQGWLILGNLMGSVITCSTLVLGIVAIISPIVIKDFSPYLLARLFVVLSAGFFLFFLRSDRKLTIREAILLLGLYISFLIGEIFLRMG